MSTASLVPPSPYKGLTPFGDSDLDALLFFGRERDAEIVVANMIASRLTVLYGPSGVGKSSMLRASVARLLRALPERPLVVVFSSWGDDPLGALVAAVAEAGGVEPAADLVATVERASAAHGDVYLVLDQAEEYFLYHPGDGGFEPQFARLVTEPLRVNVLLSLREDALAQLDRFKARIPNILGNYLRLDRLDRAAGSDAVRRPVERYHALGGAAVVVEPALVDAVLDQVTAGRIGYGLGGLGAVETNGRTSGIEAPFLQLVMQRVWEVERAAGSLELRAATLEGLGGAETVVADHLERAMAALGPREREIAAALFNHLVTPSGTKIAHGIADLAEYARVPEAEVRPVVASLAEHRILRPDEGGRYEIFHDVLAGAVLAWRTRFDAEQAVERARAEARRRHRRLGFLAVGALVALAAMAAVTLYALGQRHQAQQEAQTSQGRALLASALALRDTDPELGLLLATAGAAHDPSAQAEDTLRQVLALSHMRGVVSVGGPVSSLDVDPTGARAVVVARGVASMIDLARRRVVWRRPVPHGTAAFAPGGRTVDLVTSTEAREVAASSGRPLRPPVRLRLPGDVTDVAPAPDGARASVVVGKPRAPVISLRDGARLGRMKQTGEVTGVAFAPDGRTAVSGGRDGAARLWSTGSWTVLRPFLGHVGQVLAVAYDSTGTRVATSSTDGTARVWPLTGSSPPIQLSGHTNYVNDVSFGTAGSTVTASTDGTARTWDASGRQVNVLVGHDGAVTGASFAGPGTVVTAGADGTVRIWDSGVAPELVVARLGPPAPPARRASSADGTTATVDGRVVRLRSATGGRTLDGHTDLVNAVAFSPDGTMLVTAGRDHDAVVWDVASGTPIRRLEKHFGSVVDARFSPDGRWIVTAGPTTAGLWSASDGRFLGYLRGPTTLLTAAAFEPGSRALRTREEDGTVRRYACQLCGGLDELVELARKRVAATGRVLGDEQRARYLE